MVIMIIQFTKKNRNYVRGTKICPHGKTILYYILNYFRTNVKWFENIER